MNDHELTDMAKSIGRIEGMMNSLTGPKGRIEQLEDAQVRQWWFAVAIAPTLAVMHAFARKIGLDL